MKPVHLPGCRCFKCVQEIEEKAHQEHEGFPGWRCAVCIREERAAKAAKCPDGNEDCSICESQDEADRATADALGRERVEP